MTSPTLDLYRIILLGDKCICVNNLPKVVTWKRNGRKSNPRPFETLALTITPPGHIYVLTDEWLLITGDRELIFIARRYMLARYTLSLCVRLSVCHKPVLYRNDWTNRAGFRHGGFLPPVSHCVVRKCGHLQKSRTSLWDFVPNSRLRKIRHGKSIALSTTLVVVVVDGRACWQHLYDSRRVVAVYYKSVNCNS